MPTISEVLPKAKLRTYTPEQLAAALEAKRRREAEDLGLCRYDCPICAGQGWISNGPNRPTELCPNVDIWKLRSAARYGITKEQAMSLSWESVWSTPGVGPAVTAVQSALSRGAGWVFLHGPPGIGKTLLLQVAVALSLQAKRSAAYVRMAEILDDLRAGFDSKTEGETARLDWWAELPVLAIDEFDRVRDTEYSNERRFVLLDRRYEQAIRGETITLMASNDPPESLPPYLADRVRDGRFFVAKIDGRSVRPGMEWE